MWTYPKSIEAWINKPWKCIIEGNILFFSCKRGYFAFLFNNKEDWDLIFHSGPYFFGFRGLYLNKWTLNFYHDVVIPSMVPLWVCLPKLPLPCWDDQCLVSIGNSMGRYLDKLPPEGPSTPVLEFVLKLI